MRKLTIHKELFKTGQTGFVKSCTVVNTIQFHHLDWDLARVKWRSDNYVTYLCKTFI